jgi:hypothetical protein
MSEEAALDPVPLAATKPPGRRAEIQFYVAKGEREYGPFRQSDLLAMLQSGEITKRDLVYYDGLGEWAPIEKVFVIQEQLIHFMDEGQEPEVVLEVYNIISDMLGAGEDIYYIAHQGKRFLRAHRDVVTVTNKRLLVLKYHITSHEVEDYLWTNVVSVQAKEGLMGNVFAVRLSSDHVIEVDDLPHAQINKLIQLSQEMRSG